MIEIALHFFVYALDDLSHWPKVLSRIQSILNNISSFTMDKTPNEIVYGFSSCRLLDLLALTSISNTYVARTNVVDIISFAFANQKAPL